MGNYILGLPFFNYFPSTNRFCYLFQRQDPLILRRKGREDIFRKSKRPSNRSHSHFLTMQAFFDLIMDIWNFMKVRKQFWLEHLKINILLMGEIIFFSQGSIVVPFIYSIS